MKNLRLFSKLSKQATVALAVIIISAGVSTAAYAFTPDRPTFTVTNPASHVTLNSITDNPREGDERSFFSVADAANTAPNTTAHQLTVQDGQEITLRVYVNNDAAEKLNGDKLAGTGIAKDTQVKVALPTITSETLSINASVSASNAQPKSVSDALNLIMTGGQKFSLAYEPGSAKLSNNAVGASGIKLSDNIVKNGTKIGYSQADGSLPAWFQYAGVVTLKAKVHVAGAPADTAPKSTSFTVSQQVALTTDTTWAMSVTASAAQKVKYSVGFTNTGTTQLDNIKISSALPTGASIQKGSAKLFNSTNKNGKNISDDLVTSTGVNVGSYAAKANGYVTFIASMPSNDKLTCGDNGLTTTSQVSASGTNTMDAASVVKINKSCTTAAAPVTPATPAAPTPTATAPTSQLANTGPGSVVALFAATALIGAVAYHIRTSRRLSRNG